MCNAPRLSLLFIWGGMVEGFQHFDYLLGMYTIYEGNKCHFLLLNSSFLLIQAGVVKYILHIFVPFHSPNLVESYLFNRFVVKSAKDNFVRLRAPLLREKTIRPNTWMLWPARQWSWVCLLRLPLASVWIVVWSNVIKVFLDSLGRHWWHSTNSIPAATLRRFIQDGRYISSKCYNLSRQVQNAPAVALLMSHDILDTWVFHKCCFKESNYMTL